MRFLVFGAAFLLGGCSIFEPSGDEIVFDTTLGPRTETQIESLPAGLIGDSDKRNHRGTQTGEDLEAARPGGGK